MSVSWFGLIRLSERCKAAEQDADRLTALLTAYADEYECRIDGDGFCQEHGSGGDENGPTCINADARSALDAHRVAVAGRGDT